LGEADFAQLQPLVLAFAVGLGSPAMRRKAAKASRKLRDDLSAVVAREEAGPFRAAQSRLYAQARRRKVAKASRKRRHDLSAVGAREEAEAFAAAQRGLNAEAMGRLRGAMEAAETRARLKGG